MTPIPKAKTIPKVLPRLKKHPIIEIKEVGTNYIVIIGPIMGYMPLVIPKMNLPIRIVSNVVMCMNIADIRDKTPKK